METRVENDLVKFSGYLSERSSADSVRNAIQQAAKSSGSNTVRLDFSSVERANSVGIMTYLKVFESLKIKAVYERAPVWLVEQFNVIDEFLSSDSTVSSLYARFISPTEGKHITVLLTVGKDVPILTDYKNIAFQVPDTAGTALEPDFDPELYFYFLASRASAQG